MKDIHGLKDFVYYQTVTTKLDYPWKSPVRSEETFETLIADGKVFRKEKGKKDWPTDSKAAPLFDSALIFGQGIPFENLPTLFNVISLQNLKGKMVLTAERNSTQGDVPSFRVRLQIDETANRVLAADYELLHPSKQYVSERIHCVFDNQRGYWLPVRLDVIGKLPNQIAVYRTNVISYKSFQVDSRITVGPQ